MINLSQRRGGGECGGSERERERGSVEDKRERERERGGEGMVGRSMDAKKRNSSTRNENIRTGRYCNWFSHYH